MDSTFINSARAWLRNININQDIVLTSENHWSTFPQGLTSLMDDSLRLNFGIFLVLNFQRWFCTTARPCWAQNRPPISFVFNVWKKSKSLNWWRHRWRWLVKNVDGPFAISNAKMGKVIKRNATFWQMQLKRYLTGILEFLRTIEKIGQNNYGFRGNP